MANKLTFEEAVQNRRSIYPLNNTSPISDERIKDIVRLAIENVPSSFNSQSTRLVVLLKEEHNKFWDIVAEALKAIVPGDDWPKTEKRIAGFRAAYGSILFYEDPKSVKDLQLKFPIYADRFPQWSEHSNGMHQYALWTALEAEGLGANIQHYNPLPDRKAAETWNIPLEWELKAQIVFGGYEASARDNLPVKTQKPIEDRVFVHGE